MEICLFNEDSIKEEKNVRLVPCSINFNGKAKVSSYFKERGETDGVKHASLRGRPLHGVKVELPAGYCGYVLKKKPAPNCKTFDVDQTFKQLHYWNLDRTPSGNDALVSAMDWFDISEILHSKEEIPSLAENSAAVD